MNLKAYMVAIDHPTQYREGGNHLYYRIPLTHEQRSKVWHTTVCRGQDDGIAELKRIFRKLLRQVSCYKRYPFKLETGDHIFIEGSNVPHDACEGLRLISAKRLREVLEREGWQYKMPMQTGSMQAVDGKLLFVGDKAVSTIKILKDSQFCQTVYTQTIWDILRSKQTKKP